VVIFRNSAKFLRWLSVFPIWADVLLGWLVTGGIPDLQRSAPTTWPERRWSTNPGEWHVLVNLVPLACLLAASTCFYAAGKVLAEPSKVKGNGSQPQLLPSRRVVRLVGVGTILVLGLGFIVVCMTWDRFRPPAVAFALVLYIFGQDRVAPGHVAVGICSFLNVLLGSSTSLFYVPNYPQAYYFISLIVAIYIVGVTWFARSEATRTTRSHLWGATGLILAAGILAFLLPTVRRNLSHGLFAGFEPYGIPTDGLEIVLYPCLLLLWFFIIAIPVYRAVHEPSRHHVQAVGRTGSLGHIGLDAVLAYGIVGWPGLLILILLIPYVFLGHSRLQGGTVELAEQENSTAPPPEGTS
jgi:hypothetical protein